MASLRVSISLKGRNADFDMLCTDEELQTFSARLCYEPEVVNAICYFVQPGDTCIDAGACLGQHSLLMSRLAGEDGSVLAFEPDPVVFPELQANIELNGAKNIYPLPIPLWNSKTKCNFLFSKDHTGYSGLITYLNLPQTSVELTTSTLDAFVSKDRPVRLIKLDCEGAEPWILEGAKDTLTRGVDCVIVEFNQNVMHIIGIDEKVARDFMRSLGYDFFILLPDGSPPIYVVPDGKITMSGYLYNGMFTKKHLLEAWK